MQITTRALLLDKLASFLPKPGSTPPEPTIPRKPRWGE